MTLTVNDDILSSLYLHSSFLKRFGLGFADEISKLLTEADEELVEKVAARLATMPDRGSVTTARLQSLLEEIRILNADVYNQITAKSIRELGDLAVAEATFAKDMLNQPIP